MVCVGPSLVKLIGLSVHEHLRSEAVAHGLQFLAQRLVVDRERERFALAKTPVRQRRPQGSADLGDRLLHFGLCEQVGSIQHSSWLLVALSANTSTKEPLHKVINSACSPPYSSAPRSIRAPLDYKSRASEGRWAGPECCARFAVTRICVAFRWWY